MKIEIIGKAVGKERPRRGASGSFYTPQRTKDFEELVYYSAKKEKNRTGAEFRPDAIFTLEVIFKFKGKCRADGDNMLKSVMDGLSGVTYKNDRQVQEGKFKILNYQPQDMIVIYVAEANTFA